RPAERWVLALAIAALAALAWHRSLAYGFSQDDFLSIARVRGLAPRLAGPWRVLANQWFWDAGVRLLGLQAARWHAIVLAVHATDAGLLATLLARRFSAPAALLGSALWAVHPAFRTALWWVSANGDPFLTLFMLLATAAWFSRGAWRWASPPLLLVALAWKESGLLFPLALAALATLGPAPRRPLVAVLRDPVWWVLAAVAVAWALAIAGFVGHLGGSSAAYAPSLAAIGRNLLTYASWTPTWLDWLRHDVSDAVRPAFVMSGAWVLAAGLAGLAWRPWRERGAGGAMLAAALLLAPVLPLASHTYHYYLHAPLAALAAASAALFDTTTARLAPAWRAAAAGLIATPLVAAAMLLVHALETQPFRLPGSRADGTLDRALIAEHAVADLRETVLPSHTRLRMWAPQLQAMARETGQDPSRETYEEGNVRAALLDGLALRVMISALDSVAFVRAFSPADTSACWAVYRWDGHLRAAPGAAFARVVAEAGLRR
ncbi:MAG TPA: hypothetical protein VLV15_11065, partial [Dongiaceae bacterium]|nr:hypothetical protein [Dongiaceae bacterium]